MAHVRIEDEIVVDAAPPTVWKAIKDPATHAAWHPFVTRISGEHELGAIRRCSVVVGRKTGETQERCSEEKEGRAIAWVIEEDSTGFSRRVSDWRAGFRLERRDAVTLVTAQSTFRPRNVLVRLLSPIIRRKFHQTQQAILAALKDSVENADEKARPIHVA
jgi:uncharacterized protein YndB with AHSA1/START domain